MGKAWEVIKKVFVGLGLFIAGFFLIRRGIDTTEVAKLDAEEKAKEADAKAAADLEIKNKKKQIEDKYEKKKKDKAEELKKKSKNSKAKPKKKERVSKNSPKKTLKSSRKSSKKSSR